MSQEKVEIVRSIYEAVNRRDWDAAFRDQRPDVEMTTPPGPNAGTYRGREEIQGFWEEVLLPFEAWTAEPEQFLERDDQIAVVVKVGCGPRAAAPRSRTGLDSCGRSAAARSCPCECSPSPRRPSEPPGCGSRALTTSWPAPFASSAVASAAPLAVNPPPRACDRV